MTYQDILALPLEPEQENYSRHTVEIKRLNKTLVFFMEEVQETAYAHILSIRGGPYRSNVGNRLSREENYPQH